MGFGPAQGAGQAADAQLTDLAGLSYSGNALKVVRVNAGETAFELATASGSGTPWHVFRPSQAVFPTSNAPALSARNLHGILGFDDTTAESVIFEDALADSYASGSDLTIKIYWTAAATSGTVMWSAEIETLASQDIDSDGYDTAENSTADTTNATSGIYTVSTIALTNAEADVIAAGTPFRLRIARVPGSDTLVGDAQLLRVTVEQ